MSLDLVNRILKQSGLPPLNAASSGATKVSKAPLDKRTPVTVTSTNRLSSYPQPFTVEVQGKNHTIRFWKDEKVDSLLLACDTETTLVTGPEVPTLVLITFSSGDETVI